MPVPIKRRRLSKEEAVEILKIQPKDINGNLLRELFANTFKSNAKYNPEDEFEIPTEYRSYKTATWSEDGNASIFEAPNWKDIITTTVGRFIVNSFWFRFTRNIRKKVVYINKAFDSKVIASINEEICELFFHKEITTDEIIEFINHGQWIGYNPTRYVVPSMTIDTIRLPKNLEKEKARLVNGELGQRAREGDIAALSSIEKELISKASDQLINVDPGFDLYLSGCRGSIGNNYKNTAIMRGAMANIARPGEFAISMASLNEGIPSEEMHHYGDLVVQASYGRGVQTAMGGYITKQLNFAFQSLVLNPDENSDCKTPKTLRETIDNYKDFRLRFVKENNKLVMIDRYNFEKYKGRTVELRSPLYCGDELGICAKCAGLLYYRMKIVNAGLVSGNIGSAIMGAAMKNFHDMSVKVVKVDFAKYCSEL